MRIFSSVLCVVLLTFTTAEDKKTATRISNFGSNSFHGGQGFPGNQFPGQGYPGQGFPGQGFPGQGFPGQGFPGQGFPGQGFPGSSSCKYWCRTPQRQYYCCDQGNNNNPSPYPSVRPGFCPPVRPSCPPTRFGPPVTCAHDSSCRNFQDKCCYDTCLQQHVCKPAQSYGGGFGLR